MFEKQSIPNKKTFEKGPAIEQVERLHLRAYAKAEVILIAEGLKPATEIDLHPEDSSAKDIIDAAKKLGLVAMNHPNTKQIVIIAKDTDTAITLSKIDASKDHLLYGRLMGFPETAVQAFVGDKPMLSRRETDALTEGLVMNEMSLSRDHCADELPVLQRWDDAVKSRTQTVYEELYQEKYGVKSEISSLAHIDIKNEEQVVSILERGSDEVLEIFAKNFNVPLEKVRLIAHCNRMRIQTQRDMYPVIAKRLQKNPQLDGLESSLGMVMECVEPQVRDVVKNLLSKGYHVKESGFMGMLAYQGVRVEGGAFADMVLSKKTIDELAAHNIVVEIESDEIRLLPQKECSLETLTQAWGSIISELPPTKK